MGFENIIEGNGIGITLAGMLIVYIGLVLVTLYIASLPRLMALMVRYQERKKARALAVATLPASGAMTDDQLLLVAIGYVIQAETEQENLLDYQRITIQRDETQRVWAVAGKMRTLSTRL